MEKNKKALASILVERKTLRFVFAICTILWLLIVINVKFSSISSHYGIVEYWVTSSKFGKVSKETLAVDPCFGRYIYIHEIPSKYNTEILTNCSYLLKWPISDMCSAILNMGLGPLIESSNDVLGKNSWFVTHPNLLEVIFHNRMKKYKCLTNDSSRSSLIYVPFYAGLNLGRYLWNFDKSVRDSAPIELLNWLVKKSEWERFRGSDHFFVAGRTTWDFRRLENSDWGSNMMYLPQVENMTILSTESSPWIYQDFSIPYLTHFHTLNDDQVFRWENKMRGKVRPYLFSFVGGPRPDQGDSIHGELIDQCVYANGSCKWLQCSSDLNCDNPIYVMNVLESSRFCLQPRGDTATRRSIFDSILAGCIPVFFSVNTAYTQYLWHLPKDYKEYSVYIPEDTIKNGTSNIETMLRSISMEEEYAMREKVISLIPNIMYANLYSSLDKYEDAFDIAVKSVTDRVRNNNVKEDKMTEKNQMGER